MYHHRSPKCFSLGRGDIAWLGGSKKSNWIIYIPPSVIYLLFSYLINMKGWIYHDWYIESEIIYVTPWKLLRIFKVAKYWKQLNLSQYCIYATNFLICLTTSEFSTLDKSYKKKTTGKKAICCSLKKMSSWMKEMAQWLCQRRAEKLPFEMGLLSSISIYLSIYVLIKLWSSWLYDWLIDCLFVCLRACVRILDTEWLL